MCCLHKVWVVLRGRGTWWTKWCKNYSKILLKVRIRKIFKSVHSNFLPNTPLEQTYCTQYIHSWFMHETVWLLLYCVNKKSKNMAFKTIDKYCMSLSWILISQNSNFQQQKIHIYHHYHFACFKLIAEFYRCNISKPQIIFLLFSLSANKKFIFITQLLMTFIGHNQFCEQQKDFFWMKLNKKMTKKKILKILIWSIKCGSIDE